MRIIQITPGTGNFYCGNCIRDNTLVTALRALGHDVTMVPLYLPMHTDEHSASDGLPIFYGGINVYLQQKMSLFRHTPRWLDKMFDNRGLLFKAAERAGMTRARDLGELTVSMLEGEEGQQLKELERLVDWLRHEPPCDLVSLSNVMLIGMARKIKAALNVPLVCTMQGEDGFLDSLIEPYRSHAWQLLQERAKDVDLFIGISRYYTDIMRERMKLAPGQAQTVYNGISTHGYDPVDPHPTEIKIGYISRFCHAKGFSTLVDAFIHLHKELKYEHATLHLGGSMTRSDEDYVAQIREKWVNHGLESHVHLHPNLSREEKIQFLQGLHVMSVPATYGEAFGLYVLEGLLAGVPQVLPRHAVFPELAQQMEGLFLCEPDDPAALAHELKRVLDDLAESRKKALAGRAKVLAEFSAERMAQNYLQAVQPLISGRTVEK